MKIRNLALAALSMTASLGVLRAASATVLYDNGQEGQYSIAYPINDGGGADPSPVISDSFSLASQSTLNGIDFGLVIPEFPTPSDTLQAVAWSITAGADGGTSYGSGVASPSSTPLYTNSYLEQNVFKASFSISNLDLGAGTYYLNMWGATVSPTPVFAYWEDAAGSTGPGGASLAFDNQYGPLTPANGSSNCFFPASNGYCSQSFQILGTVDSGATVPEPGSLALFGAGAGLLALAAVLGGRRGKRAG